MMKPQDIKVGHIYFVNFSPIKKGEFPGDHLAVVVKKNYDQISFVVIPMTSKEKGSGINKIDLGILQCLPPHLATSKSYAVIDQIRTTGAERFSALVENGIVVDAQMPRPKMNEIYRALIKDLLHDVPDDQLREIIFPGFNT